MPTPRPPTARTGTSPAGAAGTESSSFSSDGRQDAPFDVASQTLAGLDEFWQVQPHSVSRYFPADRAAGPVRAMSTSDTGWAVSR